MPPSSKESSEAADRQGSWMRAAAESLVPARLELIRALVLMSVSAAGMVTVLVFCATGAWWDGVRAFCGTLVLLLALLLA